MTRFRVAAAGLLLCLPVWGSVCAQEIESLSVPAGKAKSYVLYDAERQVVPAEKKTALELRFQVVNGFHVNSHAPKSELLIPTRLVVQSAVGVKAGAIEYPAGTSYSFSFDPANKLDVYSGAFAVKLPLIASAGPHTLNGTLSYQACDHAACYPPKSLPVQIVFTAR